jgi:YD repeat-containing protein
MKSLSKFIFALLALSAFLGPDDSFAFGENYDELGFKKNKAYLKFSPEEYVNVFSGNLLVTHTDLTLPGNGGLDLKLQRTYNSKLFADFRNIDNPTISGLTLGSLGLGWDMHFGRISDYGLTVINDPNEFFLQMPDGSIHQIYSNNHPNITSHVGSTYITEDFWIIDYDPATDRYTMTLPDGTEYIFSRRVTNGFSYSFLYVTSIRDKNGNEIAIEYYDCCNMTNNDPDTGIIGTCPDPTNAATITRHIKKVTDSAGREINFTMLNTMCRGNAISSIDANGNVYNYVYYPGDDRPSTTWLHWDGGSGRLLAEVQPPEGPIWQYFYDVDPNDSEPDGELVSLKYPSGGVAQYDYETVVLDLLNSLGTTSPVQFRMLASRTTSGPDITPGTWTFDYDPTNTRDIATVTDSCGNKEIYEFFGLRAGSFNGGWSIGLLNNKEVRDSVNLIFEADNNMWTPYQISNDGNDPIAETSGIFLPLLDTETISRDGVNYITDFTYNTFYDSPTQIAESGEISRTTDITYFEDLSAGNYIIGKPLVTTTTVGTESKTIINSYDISGNLLSEDRFGVLAEFSYHPDGNLEWQRNARGFYTHFDQYAFGVAGRIRLGSSDDLASDPTIVESRSINWEGTISSFTDGRGHTTSYSYDGLNRLTSITPPPSGEAQTTIEYDNLSAQSMIVRKSDSAVQHFLDGFGRPIGTFSATGIQTEIDYDACGRKVYESLPFDLTTPNVGESFTYDPLGRMKSMTHPDNTKIDLSYSGNSVTVKNERNVNTTFNYASFGDPDEKRLISVLDADNNTTSYEYDLLGNITRVESPQGSDRIFTYNSKNFLISANHPESGTAMLGHDDIGNVTSKTNADGSSIGFEYDRLNRLTLVDHPSGEDDVIFDYDDASNRTLMESSSASYSYAFQYDQSNRLTREDVSIGGMSYSVDFIYDEKNNLIQSIYPSGEVVDYDYDADGRILDIPPSAGNFSYHPSGGPIHFDNQIGVSSDFTYDSRGRLKTLQVSRTFPYLLVTKEGLGNGTVTSTPPEIDCGSDCVFLSSAEGTEVTLTQTPDPDSNFVSWGGDPDCTDGVVTMIGTKVCIATYALKANQETLTVTKDGSGTGTVTSSPPGIDCGGDCTENYDVNTEVTLTATPDAGFTFNGWSGDPDCSDGVVTMDASKTCNATFGLQRFTLNVVNLSDGFGSGIITSNPTGISCGGDCSELYDENTVVTLTPMPDSGSQFGSWSGDCDTNGTVTLDSDKSCAAKFVKFFTLTIQKNGTGSGTIASDPPGIDCGGDCSESYGANSIVSFNITPDPGSTFVGWSGPSGCPTSPTSSALIVSDLACTARFDLITVHTLTVNKAGTGDGTVTSSPAGIDCGADCTESYNDGTNVTLTAMPAMGSGFTGWSGDADCSDGVVTMDAAKSCTANFTLTIQHPLTVTKDGTGTGMITSSPGGIDCGADCTENYDENTQVTLTVTPDAGSIFTIWTGDADCADGVITLDASKTCTAEILLEDQPNQLFVEVEKLPFVPFATVSIDGDLAIVGAPSADPSGNTDQGSALIFERDVNGLWQQVQEITASDGVAGDNFGTSVSISGDWVVVGVAVSDIVNPGQGKQGKAYLFHRDLNGVWREQQVLSAIDGKTNDDYGEEAILRGDKLAVRAHSADVGAYVGRGAVYVYEKDQNDLWNQVAKLTSPVPDEVIADPPDFLFGIDKMAFSGDKLLTQFKSGSFLATVYFDIFERSTSGTWSHAFTKLNLSLRQGGIDGDAAIVDGEVFKRISSSNWTRVQSLGLADAYISGQFALVGPIIYKKQSSGSFSLFQTLDKEGPSDIRGDRMIIEDGYPYIFEFGDAFKLAVTKSGTGTGSITSTPVGVSCDESCLNDTGDFLAGTEVTLTPVPGSISEFAGWSGDPDCADGVVIMDANKVCTAIFNTAANTFTLTVIKSGEHQSKLIVSDPPGISCEPDCTEDYAENRQVTLSTSGNASIFFLGWSGDPDCEDGVVTMDANKTCIGTFEFGCNCDFGGAIVGTSGNDTLNGTSGDDIICGLDGDDIIDGRGGNDCLYGAAGNDTLRGDRGNDSLRGGLGNDTLEGERGDDELRGGDGDDSLDGGQDTDQLFGGAGVDTCLNGESNSDCELPATQHTLTVGKSGTGSGTVTSSPTGIDCGADCTEDFIENTSVTLTATPDAGSSFAGWTGDCDVNGMVTMNAAKSCTATFDTIPVQQFTLNVGAIGTGSGTVTSNPSGIDCGIDCSEDYNDGTNVTLIATPDSGSTFDGWSGDCDVNGMVTMDAAKSCSATFTASSQLFTLTVNLGGTGTGTVTSNAPGIDCGVDCTEDYLVNTLVTLTPTPDAGSTFVEWSGDADCSDGMVTVDANKNCSATFDIQSQDPCDCNDPNAILGTSGNDTLMGTQKSDILCGLDGDDTLIGQGGNDCLFGGRGNDTIQGDNGADDLFGGDDNDTIDGGRGNDLLDGGNGTDDLDGGNNTDTCLNGETNTNCEQFSGLRKIISPLTELRDIIRE